MAFYPIRNFYVSIVNLVAFHHRTNAFGAKNFLNRLAIFNNRHFLKIGFEHTIGSSLRKTTIMTKNSCLATSRALCHFKSLSILLTNFGYNCFHN